MQAAEWTYEYSAFGYYKQQKLWDNMRKEKQTSVVTLQDVNLILCGRKFINLANTTVTHCVSWTKNMSEVVRHNWRLRAQGGGTPILYALSCYFHSTPPILYKAIALVGAQTDKFTGRLSKNHPLYDLIFFSDCPTSCVLKQPVMSAFVFSIQNYPVTSVRLPEDWKQEETRTQAGLLLADILTTNC